MSDLKARLKNGEAILGTMINSFDHQDVVKIFQVAGFDMFVIDNEHGAMDYSKVGMLLSYARALGIGGIVRIPEPRREVVMKYMELGADGILMPNADNAEDVKKVIEYAKYAPMGNRGISLYRPHTGFEKIPSGRDYMKRQNEETLIICQIESKKGVENVDAILDIDGVDAVFIGPNDLSQGYDIIGQFDNPILINAIDRVLKAAQDHEKYCGIFSAGPAEDMKKWLDKGMKLNLWSNDTTMLMQSARGGVSVIKGYYA